MKRKIIFGLLGFFVLIAGVVLFVLRTNYLADRIRVEIIGILAREFDINATIDRLNIDVFAGEAVAEGVAFRRFQPPGAPPENPFAEARRIAVRVLVGQLFNKRVVIESLEVDDARVRTELSFGRLQNWPAAVFAARPASQPGAWTVDLRRAELRNAQFDGTFSSANIPKKVSWATHGTWAQYLPHPDGRSRVDLRVKSALLAGFDDSERIDMLSAEVALDDGGVQIDSFVLRSARLSLAARGFIPFNSTGNAWMESSASVPSTLARPFLPRDVDLDGHLVLGGRLDVKSGRPKWVGNVEVTGLKFRKLPFGDVATHVRYEGDKISFRDARIAFSGSRVTTSGSLTLSGSFPLELEDTRIHGLSIPDLIKNFGEYARGWVLTVTSGRVQRFRGALAAARPRFEANGVNLQLSDLTVDTVPRGARVFHQRASSLVGTVVIDSRGVELRGTRVRSGNTDLAVSGRINFNQRLELDVESRSFSFDDMPNVGGLRFFGLGDVRARISGQAADAFVSGFVNLREVRVKVPRQNELVIGEVTGPILFNRERFSFPHTRIEGDGVRATVSARLDLASEIPEIDIWARLDELRIERVLPRASWRDLDGLVNRISQARGDQQFGEMVRDLVRRTYGPEVDAASIVDPLLQPPADDAPAFIREVLADAAPDKLLGRVRGTVRGEVRLRGPLDAERLSGSANIQIQPIALFGEPMYVAVVECEFAGREVNLRRASIWRGEGLGQLRLKGRLHADGRFELDGETNDLTLADFENRRLKAMNLMSKILFSFHVEGRAIREPHAAAFDIQRVDGLRGRGHITLRDAMFQRHRLGTSVIDLTLRDTKLTADGRFFFEPPVEVLGDTPILAGVGAGAGEQDTIRVEGSLSLADNLPFIARVTLTPRNWASILLPYVDGAALLLGGRGVIAGEIVNSSGIRADGVLHRVEFSRVSAITGGDFSQKRPGPGFEIKSRFPVAVGYRNGELRLCRAVPNEPVDQSCESAASPDRRLKFTGGIVDFESAGSFSESQIEMDVEARASVDTGLLVKSTGYADLSVLGALVREIDGTVGRATFSLSLAGPWSRPRLRGSGRIDPKRPLTIPFRVFPYPLEKITAGFDISHGGLSFRQIKGQFAGGTISQRALCDLNFGLESSPEFECRVHVTNAKLRYPSEITSVVTGDVTYKTDFKEHRVESNLVGDIRYAMAAFSSLGGEDEGGPASPPRIVDSGKEAFTFELNFRRPSTLRAVAPDQWIDTELRIRDMLTVKGSPQRVGMMGDLDLVSGKAILFKNNFLFKRAHIQFDQPNAINPQLNISAEAKLKDSLTTYDTTVEIRCRLDRLQEKDRDSGCFTLYANPVLSREDVVAVLLTGSKVSDINTSKTNAQGQGFQIGQIVLGASGIGNLLPLDTFKIAQRYSDRSGTYNNYVTVGKRIGSVFELSATSSINEPGKDAKIQLDFNPVRALSLSIGYDSNTKVQTSTTDSIPNFGGDIKWKHEF